MNRMRTDRLLRGFRGLGWQLATPWILRTQIKTARVTWSNNIQSDRDCDDRTSSDVVSLLALDLSYCWWMEIFFPEATMLKGVIKFTSKEFFKMLMIVKYISCINDKWITTITSPSFNQFLSIRWMQMVVNCYR